MVRPFISFLTDFGPDAAAAICRGVMLSIAPDAQILDISHSVRKFAIADGGFLLWTTLPWLPVGVHVAVVDPGVGTARRPIGILTARGDVLVGPDNGLLVPAAERLGGSVQGRVLENPEWRLPRTSATFHGRDIFAPMAGHLAIGGPFDQVGPRVDVASLVDLRFPEPVARDDGLDCGAIYVDSFGNIRLAASVADLVRAVGTLEPGVRLAARFEAGVDGSRSEVTATWERTFGSLGPGEMLLYEDSSGQLALGEVQGDAAARLGVEAGRSVRIVRA